MSSLLPILALYLLSQAPAPIVVQSMGEAVQLAQQIRADNPGEDVEIINITSDDWARGVGAGVTASGTDITGKHDAGAPDAHLTGGTGASGGFFKGEWDVVFKAGAATWVLFIIGGLFLAGGGVALYLGMKRAAIIAFGIGAAVIVAGLLPPVVAAIIVIGALVIGAAFYFYSEWRAKRGDELGRMTTQVISETLADPTIPETAKTKIKGTVESSSDAHDKDEFNKIVVRDALPVRV